MTSEVKPDKLKELIQLQYAHVTQITTEEGGKGPWFVRENVTSKNLFELPFNLNEQQVLGIINFARKFELTAFNAGIKFQKTKQNELLVAQKKELEILVHNLKNHNDYLADALEKSTAYEG